MTVLETAGSNLTLCLVVATNDTSEGRAQNLLQFRHQTAVPPNHGVGPVPMPRADISVELTPRSARKLTNCSATASPVCWPLQLKCPIQMSLGCMPARRLASTFVVSAVTEDGRAAPSHFS